MITARKGKRLALLVACAGVVVVFIAIDLCWDDILIWYRPQRGFQRLPNNAQEYPEYKHGETGIVFVQFDDFLIAKRAVSTYLKLKGDLTMWENLCEARGFSLPTLEQWKRAKRVGFVGRLEFYASPHLDGLAVRAVFNLR